MSFLVSGKRNGLLCIGPPSGSCQCYKEAFDEMLREQEGAAGQRSLFQRRVSLFFDILRNGKKFRRYGYTSMPSYLFHSVWTHFFDREVRGI